MEGFPMYRFLFKFGVVILVGFFSVAWLVSSACAISVDVYATSSPEFPTNPGMTLQAGDYLTISAAETDLWTAWSNTPDYITNADGIVPTIEPLYTNLGLTSRVGALVGRIDIGTIGTYTDDYYFIIGTNFGPTKVGPGLGELPAGPLYLLLWDGNYSDNFGAPIGTENINYLTANVSAVPLPPSVLLLGSGLLGLGLLRRKWSLKN